MKKMNFEANQKEVLQFVEELQRDPLLEGYEINQSNANDFYILKEDKKNCASCNGLSQCKNMNEGYALFYEDSNFVLQPCRFKKEANRLLNENQKIKTLFISKSILSANLESFDITNPNRKKIYEHILKFLTQYQQNKFIKGLYLYGTFATGKTFILGCIANELARKGIESLIIYFPDLVVELKSSIGTSRLEELINYLKSVDVLFLDDLGSENMTPWLRDEILGPVLNYRLMEEKPIFISSNIDPTTEDLRLHFSLTKAPSDQLKGARIQSRLEGLVIPIELDNPQYKR